MSLRTRIATAVRRAVGSAWRWHGVLGLNYHRIGDGRASRFDRGLWSATVDGFDRQLGWLKARFDVIAPRDIPDALRVRRGRHALVTFDDGYEDNFSAAFPVLRRHGLPASFFVATGFVDRPRLPWWDEIAWMVRSSPRAGVEVPGFLAPVAYDEPDRERAIRALLRTYYHLPASRGAAFLEAAGVATGSGRFPDGDGGRVWMTWDELREMKAGGMTIGGHTVHHPILSRMPRDDQWREISGCARRLEAELGEPMRAFAYPGGLRDAFDADTRACLREAGVQAAFSYYGGFRPPSAWDDLDIPRIAVEQHMTFAEFRAEVLAPWLRRS